MRNLNLAMKIMKLGQQTLEALYDSPYQKTIISGVIHVFLRENNQELHFEIPVKVNILDGNYTVIRDSLAYEIAYGINKTELDGKSTDLDYDVIVRVKAISMEDGHYAFYKQNSGAWSRLAESSVTYTPDRETKGVIREEKSH